MLFGKRSHLQTATAILKAANETALPIGALIIILVSSILIFLLNRSRIRRLRLKNEMQKNVADGQNKD